MANNQYCIHQTLLPSVVALSTSNRRPCHNQSVRCRSLSSPPSLRASLPPLTYICCRSSSSNPVPSLHSSSAIPELFFSKLNQCQPTYTMSWRDNLTLAPRQMMQRSPRSSDLNEPDFSSLMAHERKTQALRLDQQPTDSQNVFAEPTFDNIKHTSLGYVLESRRNPIEQSEANNAGEYESPRDSTLPSMSQYFSDPTVTSDPVVETAPDATKKRPRSTLPLTLSMLRRFFKKERRATHLPRSHSREDTVGRESSKASSGMFGRFHSRTKSANTL